MSEQLPKVGVGICVFKDGKILLGRRKNSHGAGEYAAPGGHLEFGETFEECAIRETAEEAGIEIEHIILLCLTNSIAWGGKHYINIDMRADWKAGEPKVLEPDKRMEWNWYDINNLPQPLFGSCNVYAEAIKTGKVYFGTIRK